MANLWKNPDFILDWEMAALVIMAEDKFGANNKYRCFYFVISPVFGGGYDIENIQNISIIELIAYSGDMAEQIKDLPEGGQVKIVVITE